MQCFLKYFDHRKIARGKKKGERKREGQGEGGHKRRQGRKREEEGGEGRGKEGGRKMGEGGPRKRKTMRRRGGRDLEREGTMIQCIRLDVVNDKKGGVGMSVSPDLETGQQQA